VPIPPGEFALPEILLVHLARHSLAALLCVLALGTAARAEDVSRVGEPKPLSHGTPQRQAPYAPGKSPYVTGHRQRPKYFVPPTNPRTPREDRQPGKDKDKGR
jgi:hypothetical protein